jgi:hypothetical protein
MRSRARESHGGERGGAGRGAPGLASLALALVLAPGARAFSDGPPVHRANDPPSPQTCRGCHTSFALNAGDVTLQLLDAASRQPFVQYVAGRPVDLVFRITSGQAGRARWGFQLVTLSGTTMAGSFQAGFGNQVVRDTARNRDYIEHEVGGVGDNQPAGFEWAFRWTPPAVPAAVTAYACGNAANRSFTSSGDYIECATFALAGVAPDADGDGVPDAEDVCPDVADPDQSDGDLDGVGDACDDCVVFDDPAQSDADGDTLGDACEITWGDAAPRGAPDGLTTVADVVLALRFAVGLEAPSVEELRRVNVAPASVVPGSPDVATPTAAPPRVVDVADVVLLLRAAVELTRFTSPV